MKTHTIACLAGILLCRGTTGAFDNADPAVIDWLLSQHRH
jgi:hypothetical protein